MPETLSALRDMASSLFGAYRGVILGILTIFALWIAYRLTTKAMRLYVQSRSQKPENVQQFMLIWRYAWMAVATVMALIAFSGSLSGLGISAAFMGMILGWSLQAPVTGIAAWLMIILKRPFRIGDRVIISGIIGDVVDINLTHVLLNQVGGTVGGEEKSGRAVLIPNATLFQQVIYNYTFEGLESDKSSDKISSYILDEVVIMITFGSDFDAAEHLLVKTATEVTGDIIKDSGQDPFIRAEIFEYGVRIRLRYNTVAKERQRISSDIVRRIIKAFKGHQSVEFCYPHQQILYRANAAMPALAEEGAVSDQEILKADK